MDKNIFDFLLEQISGNLKMVLLMSGKEAVEQEDIEKSMNTILSLYPTFEESDIKDLYRAVESYFHVQHIKGCAIYDDYVESRDWYSKNKPSDNYFWDRYKRYLNMSRKLDYNSVNILEHSTLEDLMNSLGNPNEEFEGQRTRKGLVIGDVQSGKTATYTGLICKAADAGYKVIILLAGITESLRRQTQYRVDEGVSGFTYKPGNSKREVVSEPVGVGKLGDASLHTTSYTTCMKDFVSDGAKGIISSLEGHNSTLIFVCKKNASVLENLYKWLSKDFNLDPSDGLIHAPLLLIDDEADNASVNTNNGTNTPTKINGWIRQICNKFKNTTYVGFTATPFANVFIEPDNDESMGKADLFPTHFIYVLPVPDTYIGPNKIFIKDSPYYKNIKFITDVKEPSLEELSNYSDEDFVNCPFYASHKIFWRGELPISLRESVISFCIGNAIRDFRGDESAPRTMMVNMSRFVAVQEYIKNHVSNLMNEIKSVIKFDFSDDIDKNRTHRLFRDFKSVFDKLYSKFSDIEEQLLSKSSLVRAIDKIEVIMVNGGKSAQQLDYEKTPRVIAVGGLALSRGLTLEGLLVSYFYRNTATFDVLMQMGRWFGYRKGYDDIFQIWTTHTSVQWYQEITCSTDELKADLSKMFEDHMKPIDFGIKVRNESEALDITARNKMRNSHHYQLQMSFWGGYFETPYVAPNNKINHSNFEAVKYLIEQLKKYGYKFEKIKSTGTRDTSNSVIAKSVSKGIVISFLNNINVTKKNLKFDVEQILKFISSVQNSKLDNWDIAIRSGKSKETFKIDNENSIFYLVRTLSNASGSIGFNSHNHLGSPFDSMASLTDEEIEFVKSEYKIKYEKNIQTPPNDAWFEFLEDRNPLLTIYLAKPNNEPEEMEYNVKKFCEGLNGEPIVGLSIGFPSNGGEETQVFKYSVNNIYYQQLMEEYTPEEDVDESNN